MTKHKYYDVIVAWASGEEIQCRRINDDWYNLSEYVFENNPDFSRNDLEWRVKPKTITQRYRLAYVEDYDYKGCTCVDITNSCIDNPVEYSIQGFIRWVGDTVEVEIEV